MSGVPVRARPAPLAAMAAGIDMLSWLVAVPILTSGLNVPAFVVSLVLRAVLDVGSMRGRIVLIVMTAIRLASAVLLVAKIGDHALAFVPAMGFVLAGVLGGLALRAQPVDDLS
jgi:hypothetical protein